MTKKYLTLDDFDQISDIPEDYLCEISSYMPMSISGSDASDYLQGQLTADLNSLTDDAGCLTSHCDAKGKTLHIGMLVKWSSSILMFGHNESSEVSLTTLKKFGVFSQVNIENRAATLNLFAGKGKKLESVLNTLFETIPTSQFEVYSNALGGVIRTDSDNRFFIWLTSNQKQKLLDAYTGNLCHEDIWHGSQIKAGIPELREQTHSQFIPQMMNLQALNAISFTKGCYMGQETVARAKYLGKNKRRLYLLGCPHSVKIAIGSRLKFLTGENWKNTGTVLSSATMQHETLVLAILPNDFNVNDQLNIEDSVFNIQPLPYLISE